MCPRRSEADPSRPRPPRGLRASIQPGVAAVSAEWLDEFDQSTAAREVDRLGADQDLLLALQLARFEGDEWEELANVLIEYGFAVVRSWIRTGHIFERCRAQGLRGASVPSDLVGPMRDAAEELAMDTVGDAIVSFRDDVLKRHRWSPVGGASLKTYFVGQALIRFIGVLRSWVGEQPRQTVPLDALDQELLSRDDPSRTAVWRDEIHRAAEAIDDPLAWSVVEMTAEGIPQDEIARRLGLASARAVEGRLHRIRRKMGGLGAKA